MKIATRIKTTGALILLLCFNCRNVLSCDVCGCSAGGNYFGILPQFQKNFVGVRYQYRAFDSEHLPLFPGEPAPRTVEMFHTTELWGRYVPHKRIHLFAFVPYNYYLKDEEQVRSVVAGPGDVSFMANYILINTGEKPGKSWRHALQAGAGVKLPTGKSDNIQKHSGMLIPSLQPGTGAFDVPFNLIYTLRYKRLGLNMEGSYRINTVNKRAYKFGDRVSASARLFYWKNIMGLSLLPHAGGVFEYGFTDRDNGKPQEYTGSMVLNGSAGMDIYFRRIILNFSSQFPLLQHIARGQITGRQRYNAGIAFLLAKQKE